MLDQCSDHQHQYPWNLVEIPCLRPHPRPTEWEIQGVELSIVSPRWLWYTLKCENHRPSLSLWYGNRVRVFLFWWIVIKGFWSFFFHEASCSAETGGGDTVPRVCEKRRRSLHCWLFLTIAGEFTLESLLRRRWAWKSPPSLSHKGTDMFALPPTLGPAVPPASP